MNSFIDNFTQKCIQKPELIYLIDGIGAFVSLASMLLLYNLLPEHFTLPFTLRRNLLGIMFAIILMDSFFYYRGYLYYLKNIVLMNSIYCAALALILISKFKHITSLEIAYFSIEMLVLIAVIALENHILRAYKNQFEG